VTFFDDKLKIGLTIKTDFRFVINSTFIVPKKEFQIFENTKQDDWKKVKSTLKCWQFSSKTYPRY
jgi:hypothetical protein